MSKKESNNKEEKTEIKENAKVKEEKVEKKDSNIFIVTFLVIGILGILVFINFISSGFNNKNDKYSDISKVKKILNTKYNKIECVDSDCEYVVSLLGDELKKSIYTVYDLQGKKIATLKIDYSKKSEGLVDIVAATKKYIITRTLKKDEFTYMLRGTNGKPKYTSKKEIESLSDNLVAIYSGKDYKIIDSNGKTILDSVKSYSKYADGKYINIKLDNKNLIIDEKGTEVLKNYLISQAVESKDNDKLEFLIVKNTSNYKYNYFNIKNGKIEGDAFENYSQNDEGEIIISKVINNDTKKYVLKNDGKQIKYDNDEDEIYDKIKEKISSEDYYIYRYGIKSLNQKYVIVNSKSDNSIGVLNVNNKKYSKLFQYNGSYNYGAVVNEIGEDNNNILRITCSTSYCEEEKNLIYDLDKNKVIYKENKNGVSISEFALYDGGYKIIRYSYVSNDEKYAGKTVVYNKKNKEIYKSENYISIIDKKSVIDSSRSSSLILYSTKVKKVLNDEKTLAIRFKLGENYFYKFTDSKDKINIINTNGKSIISVPSNSYVTYANNYIIYLTDNKIFIYNAAKNRTKLYKLKSNEKLNDEYNDIIKPYRGVTFINNTNDKIVKFVNSKGSVMRTIRNAEISKVKVSKDGNALIFVKTQDKNIDLYGLYIAK